MDYLKRKWNDQRLPLNDTDDTHLNIHKQLNNNYDYYDNHHHGIEYTKNSTIHGLKYIGDKRRHIIERILWLVIAIISLIFCIKLLINVRRRWEHGPIIVGLSEEIRPIWEIPFPTVTICPEIKSHTSQFNYTEVYHMMVEQEKMPYDGLTEEQIIRMEAISHICDDHLIHGLELGDNITTDNIFSRLNEIAPTFNETLFFCKWRNKPGDCHDYFQEVLTDEGLCFSFNNINSNEIFTDKIDSNYPEVNSNAKINHWTLENGYNMDKLLSLKSDSPYPHQVYGHGERGGLYILLRLNLTDLEYLCRGPVIGLKLLLNVPGDLPKAENHYIRLSLEKEIMIKLQPSVMMTSEGLRAYEPNERSCYYQSEKQLRFFKTYSKSNCELECLADYTLKKCGCVKFSMPREKNTPICGVQRIECYNDAEDELLHSGYLSPNLNDEIYQCNCLPTCTSLTYNTEVSSADLKWKELFAAFNSPLEEFPGMQVVRVGIFFNDNQYVASKRYEMYSHTELLATFGGLLALFFGASILSIFELIYFYTIRLFFNKRRINDMNTHRNNNNQNNNNNIEKDEFLNTHLDDGSSLQLQ